MASTEQPVRTAVPRLRYGARTPILAADLSRWLVALDEAYRALQVSREAALRRAKVTTLASGAYPKHLLASVSDEPGEYPPSVEVEVEEIEIDEHGVARRVEPGDRERGGGQVDLMASLLASLAAIRGTEVGEEAARQIVRAVEGPLDARITYGQPLIVSRVELRSPGNIELSGDLPVFKDIREYAKDRHERKKDKAYRNEAEQRRLTAEARSAEAEARSAEAQAVSDELRVVGEGYAIMERVLGPEEAQRRAANALERLGLIGDEIPEIDPVPELVELDPGDESSSED
jgi:hypothetical protein